MGNLNETEKWEENIYQLETSDPVLGGAPQYSGNQPCRLPAKLSGGWMISGRRFKLSCGLPAAATRIARSSAAICIFISTGL